MPRSMSDKDDVLPGKHFICLFVCQPCFFLSCSMEFIEDDFLLTMELFYLFYLTRYRTPWSSMHHLFFQARRPLLFICQRRQVRHGRIQIIEKIHMTNVTRSMIIISYVDLRTTARTVRLTQKYVTTDRHGRLF